MNNTRIIGGRQAVINYDPDIEMFRGEFVGLNGGADFYAVDVAGLHREGKASLDAFLDEYAKRGIEPRKSFSGKFMLRVVPDVHEAATIAAAASGESLNQWVADAIRPEAHAQFDSQFSPDVDASTQTGLTNRKRVVEGK